VERRAIHGGVTRIACRDCGEDHDLEDLEPSHGLPDDVFALSETERDERAPHGRNFCELKGEAGAASRWFVRTLVPFNVEGRDRPCCWGLWVELEATAFAEIREVWDSPDQLQAGPWPAALANDAATYPSTLGLPGSVRFSDLESIPRFSLQAGLGHPFAVDFRAGVSEDRAEEWQLHYLHRSHQGAPVSTDADPDEPPMLLQCDTHGTAPSSVVCVHLLEARDRAVGFIENSSEPNDLQAWCDACEQLFEREGEMTEAFREFSGIHLVCVFCYATIKERNSAMS
jgi:hypothetical protein